MTPFGQKMRDLRAQKQVSQKDMARALGVSAAYLSALEHGHRGRPSWPMIQTIIAYFGVIWDEAEELVELARLSHPRIVIDTAGLSPAATAFANRLAKQIPHLPPAKLAKLRAVLEET